MPVLRTDEEIERVRAAAQAAAFKAQDAGDIDDAAEAIYGTLQWVFGHDDADPVGQYLDEG